MTLGQFNIVVLGHCTLWPAIILYRNVIHSLPGQFIVFMVWIPWGVGIYQNLYYLHLLSVYSGRKEAAKSESQTSKTPGKRQSFSPGFPLALEKLENREKWEKFFQFGKCQGIKTFLQESHRKVRGFLVRQGKLYQKINNSFCPHVS